MGIPKLPDAVRDGVNQAFRRSAERLVELLQSNAPDAIIANEVTLLHRRMFLLQPELMSEYEMQDRLSWLRMRFGVCTMCGEREMVEAEPLTLCEVCEARILSEEDASEAAEDGD